MYSTEENHVAAYRQWTDLKENEKPDFFNNLEFMFRFQLGEMYFRYFLFNFAGRESDVQYSLMAEAMGRPEVLFLKNREINTG